jgi:hypothetical protein
MGYRNTGNGEVTSWYRNNPSAWFPGEKRAKLPGGANSILAGRPVVGIGALGYDVTIGTPIGDQTISIPLEKIVADAANMGMKVAIPQVNKALEAEMPNLLKMAEASVINELWPKIQPKLRNEADRALATGKTEIRRDLTIAVIAIGASILGGIVLATKASKR